MKRLLITLCLLTYSTTAFSGCGRIYYAGMEKLGYQKRDILVSRVEKATKSQEDAKEQFSSALEQFESVVDFDGGNLEATYKRLDAEFKDSEAAAQNLTKRIDDIERVAEDLFKEWAKEIETFSKQAYKRQSEEQLRSTRRRYRPMIDAMRRVEGKMEPILTAFRDNVLFLKHNLNAQAISSLKGEFANVESDIGSLIKEMEVSIDEAESFISSMEKA